MEDRIVVGIDEAGRGPLAGRVYAACVVLDKNKKVTGLNDSKKLSETRRNFLYHEIKDKALGYGISYAEADEIDNINILQATFLAMRRALGQLKVNFNYIMVDGNIYPFKDLYDGEAVIKGDSKIEEIMAASILAKVERDSYMYDISKLYPHYHFDKHKGYPTKLHSEMIQKYGILPFHRKTFCKVREFVKN